MICLIKRKSYFCILTVIFFTLFSNKSVNAGVNPDGSFGYSINIEVPPGT